MKKMVYKGHKKYLLIDHPMHGENVRSIPHKMRACDWSKLWIDARKIEVVGIKLLNAFYALPYWKHSNKSSFESNALLQKCGSECLATHNRTKRQY